MGLNERVNALSFNKYLLRACYMLSPIQGSGNTVLKTVFLSSYSLVGKIDNNK